MSLLDVGRQWFKSRVGLEATVTARELSFCGHAIQSDAVFEVPDAHQDARFADNPLVTGEPHVRFYAGAPLITSDGYRLDTLCVIDHVARRLPPEQRVALQALSRQVVRQMEARAMARELSRTTRFQAAVLNSPDIAMISTTIEGLITGFNHAAEGLLGYRAQDMIGKRSLEVCYDPAALTRCAASLSAGHGEGSTMGTPAPGGFALLTTTVDAGRMVGSGEWAYVSQDGSICPVRISITPIVDETGDSVGYLSSARDVTEQKAAAVALQNSQKLLTTLIDTLPVGVYLKKVRAADLQQGGEMRIWNRAAEEMTGIPASEVIGKNDRGVFPSHIDPSHEERDRRLLASGTAVTVPVYPVQRPDGTRRLLRMTSVPLHDVGGEIEYIMGVAEDVTALKATEKQLRRMARIDSLTGLPNRAQFYETLDAAQSRGKRTGKAIAVMFLDIDRFKSINDSLGHAKGDLVLQEFARRLTQSVRVTDTVARLAGDEFVIVLEGLTALREADLVAEKAIMLIYQPWHLDGDVLQVTTSMGIAYDASHAYAGATLVSYADELLYEAKSGVRNIYRSRIC